MDTLKLAFDTLLIGALALPWLALFMRLFFQTGPRGEREHWFPLFHVLPEKTRDAVTAVLIVAVGYFLGSAVARISSDFFDDSELFLNVLPTEDSVRQAVYRHEYCDDHAVLEAPAITARVKKPADGTAAFCTHNPRPILAIAQRDEDARQRELVEEFFRLQESRMLLSGEDKISRLRQFHEQIEILRSATLNGAVLFFLFLFGWCAVYRAKLSAQSRSAWITYVPTAMVLLAGVVLLGLHFYRIGGELYESHRDPPLAESLLVLLGAGGFLVRYDQDSRRLFRNGCLIAVVLTSVAYGAWWWTEVLYNQQIIHSVPTIETSVAPYVED